MGTIKLKKLQIHAFRSIVDATIDFPDSGMILVRGFNADTKGSSGSGKSSIVLSIAYLMGYCPYPRTVLQSWLTDDPMSVEGTFDTAEGEAVVTRGSKLLLKVDGKVFKGSAAAIEARMQELVGLSPEMLSALTYRGQRSAGLFLSKGDSDKKEFLSSILGLDKVEAAVEAAQTKITKELDPDYRLYSTQASLEKARLDDLRAGLGSAPTPVDTSADKAILADLERRYNAGEATIRALTQAREVVKARVDGEIAVVRQQHDTKAKSINAELQAAKELRFVPTPTEEFTRLKELEADAARRLRDVLAADLERRNAMHAEVAEINARLRAVQVASDRIPKYKKEITEYQQQVAILEKNVCPTCNQHWLNADFKRDELLEKIATLENDLSRAEGLVLLEPGLKEQLEKANFFEPDPRGVKLAKVQTQLQTQIAVEQHKLDSQVKEFEREREILLSKIGVKMANADTETMQLIQDHKTKAQFEFDAIDRELAAFAETDPTEKMYEIQTRIRDAEVKYQQEQKLWEERQNQLQRQQQAFDAVAEKSKAVEAKINAEKDFVKLMGREGFLGSIFDEVLEEISAETNAILAGIPNTSHVVLRFKTETMAQKGTVKRAIVPVVSIGGHEAPLGSGLSGGMTTSVELAVDLAVSAVVARRSGCNPQWLVLDESFDGLGTVEKEACMAILKRYAEHKMVVVIDHMNEVKEMFQTFINVKCENGRTTASVLSTGRGN